MKEQRSAADEGLEVAPESPRRASKKIGDELSLPANPFEEWAARPLSDVELSCFHTQMRAADEARGQVWSGHRTWKLSTRAPIGRLAANSTEIPRNHGGFLCAAQCRASASPSRSITARNLLAPLHPGRRRAAEHLLLVEKRPRKAVQIERVTELAMRSRTPPPDACVAAIQGLYNSIAKR